VHMIALPAISYVQTEDGKDIAYWKIGRGPLLILTPNVQLGHLRDEWSIPGMKQWFETLARSFTVVRYDHRGGGLSNRSPGTQSIEALIKDIDSVASEVSPGSFILLGWISGGLPAIAYAARYPSRVSHLVLWSSFARDQSHGQAPRMKALFEIAATDWELFTETICQTALGWSDADEARRWAMVMREGTTQAEFLAYLADRRDWDVAADIPLINVPTLVLHDKHNALADEANSRELAARIPGARFLHSSSNRGVPGRDTVTAINELVGLTEYDGAGLETLTDRERQVLALVVEGASNIEIGERLFISINTVTRHLTHVYAKTGTKNRVQAARYALESGLGDP